MKKYTEDDIKFINEKVKDKNTIPWKSIFNQVKAKGLLQSCKSSNSLKCSYYNINKYSIIIIQHKTTSKLSYVSFHLSDRKPTDTGQEAQ